MLFLSLLVMGQQIRKPELVGARDAALGGSDISGAYNISSMYLNPAATVFTPSGSIFINHSQTKDNFGMGENFAFSAFKNNSQALTLGFSVFHLGYLNSFNSLPGQHILEMGYDVSFSSLITPTFSAGMAAYFQNGRTNNSQQFASTYSLGLDYAPSADISYGLVFSGLGSNLNYTEQDSIILSQAVNAPKILEIGATMSYPSSASLRRKFLFLSLANEKIFSQKGLYYKGGIEIRPFYFIALRFGYVTGPKINEPSYGLGIHFDMLNMEYTIYPQLSSYMLDQFSLSVKL